MWRRRFILLGICMVIGGTLAVVWHRKRAVWPSAVDAQARLQAWVAHPEAPPQADLFLRVMQGALACHRQIIVLLGDEEAQSPEDRTHSARISYLVYQDNQARLNLLEQAMEALARSRHPQRASLLEELLSWIEASPDLYDADRLAFREVLKALGKGLAQDQTLPAVKLSKRISEDLAALTDIEALYDKELKAIFGRFDARAIQIQRQRWNDYLAKLRALYTREQILRDFGTIVPYPNQASGEAAEIFGRALPPKTLLLTFDDGPHHTYTEEIATILKQYGIRGVFFELGQNLGAVDKDGQAHLGKLAAHSKKLADMGHALANHTYSHRQLQHQNEATVKTEVEQTACLLRALGTPSNLFRFPYGASSPAALKVLETQRLRAMAWNIDSRDWADPVPHGIADRVLRSVEAEGRGILLFHDIHERTVKALPIILDHLIAEGYQFAAWEKTEVQLAGATTPTPKAVLGAGYGQSWAVVVGIDAYTHWPRLQHATRDADAVKDALVQQFGFPADHVLTLKDQEATRGALLHTLNTKLAHLQKDDRLVFFFAGHGATRRLSSGRDLGYLVPVESDPANVAADAIPMTELQNIAESLQAKHVLFVMDACYSGLGLTRGVGSQNFLRENARRLGRQMLTAGGADQMVADGGPGGHSIFTWTFLQGLGGKADLNGDGLITATELAAFISPAVSSVSHQTPAFGSLPGSEGGEFIFELPSSTEALSAATPQLDANALSLNQKIQARLDTLKLSPPISIKKETPAVQVAVKTLEGGETLLKPAAAVPMAPRQAAQRANDRGLQAFREQRYAQAEALFAEALKLRPDFALAANNLGFVYFKQGRYGEAVRWFENTLKLDQGRAIAHFNLGEALLLNGQKERAKQALNTYLALAPKGAAADRARELLKLA